MPELPEVETVRRDLEANVLGKRIESVCVDGHRTVRRQEPSELVATVKGVEVSSLRRLGKFLLIDLSCESTLVVHLRMSGQLLWNPAQTKLHTHARLTFFGGDELHFVDPRTFGEMWVTSPDLPELWHIGPDALNDLQDWRLHERMASRRGNLKALLMNQQFVAGIGNIYADEVLFEAKVRADRRPSSLSRQSISRIADATEAVLHRAVELRGSTLSDRQYVDLFGNPGNAQSQHRVYARAGEPCLRCNSPIVRAVFGNRSAFSCPRCQR